MTRLFRKTTETSGLPPGTVIIDAQADRDAVISIFDYDAKSFTEKSVKDIQECFPFKDSPTVTWINIEGIAPQAIQSINEHFGVHPLVSEDIVSTGQRPKMEDYGEYIFIVLKMIYCRTDNNDEIIAEQVSLILGTNFVISFQEKAGDVFDPIRKRIRESKGRLRMMAADYLAYALLDAVVDNYFLIMEKLSDGIEALEDVILEDSHPATAHDIHQYKREMIFLRKQIWPLREVISGLLRNESKLIKKTTWVYLRDLYDHTIQVMDTVESFRDVISGLHDIYLASISNRMNEIMKVLTMFSAIFIPLTFLAGIYGMNFEYMPELKWHGGYFTVLSIMAAVGMGMVYFFKRKKWL